MWFLNTAAKTVKSAAEKFLDDVFNILCAPCRIQAWSRRKGILNLKQRKLIAAGMILLCALTGCSAKGAAQPEDRDIDSVSDIGTDVPQTGDEKTDSRRDHILGLTQDERLEDYDYLVKTLEDSYLCMGVRDRENPDDLSTDIFKEYREMIEDSDSDDTFYTAVNSAIYRLGQYGHLYFIEPDTYEMYAKLYKEDYEGRERWKEVLDSSVTQEGYKKAAELLKSYEEEDADGGSGSDTGKETENIHTLLLPGGEIAYVKVDYFPIEGEETYKKDKKLLYSFYDTLEGCSDLIIDITDNGGGNEGYWQELLVSPFIDKPLSCVNYALIADSENNRPYIENVYGDDELIPVSELPELPNLNRDGIEKAAYYVESVLEAEPQKYHAPFHGRIWLLVGPDVYSASESFSVFCKETGFAALAGKSTGGDGIGALDPVFIQLPHSGLLVQFTMMFGLNADGSSSEEAGTVPDILSPGTEPPLVTALRAIRSAE